MQMERAPLPYVILERSACHSLHMYPNEHSSACDQQCGKTRAVPAPRSVTSYRTVLSTDRGSSCNHAPTLNEEEAAQQDNKEMNVVPLESADNAAFVAAQEYIAFKTLEKAVEQLQKCGSECE